MAGLAPTFGRGAMTNSWVDIKNADVILVMGGNPAEAHPCGFKWVLEAKTTRGAQLIVVDPRATRTAAVADVYAPIRPGTDIAFMGGVIHYLLENDRIQREYVKAFTNASFLVRDDFAFDHGVFSGWDEERSRYDRSSWAYQLDDKGQPLSDPTLEHPRCVLQLLKSHYARYTAERVCSVTGTPAKEFRQICELIGSTSVPDRVMTSCYALGWCHHSVGSQNVRAIGIIQLLLGNIGMPGGGVNALRGHSNVQGLTDLGLMSPSLPGYLSMPTEADADLGAFLAKRVRKPIRPGQLSFWQNYPKFHVSLMKAWWGPAATAENGFAFDFLPKLDQPVDILALFERMHQGKVNGLFCQGFNPLASVPDKEKTTAALSRLKYLVTIDPLATETSTFWKRHGDVHLVDHARIATEVFRLPSSLFAEEEGAIVSSARWLQWHWKAAEPPGEAKGDAEIVAELFTRVRALYEKEGGAAPDPILKLHWPYREPTRPSPNELAREYNGQALADVKDPKDASKTLARKGEQLATFAHLQADGSTACGCWIYCGSFTEKGNQMARRDPADPTGLGITPGWAWAWPANRRLLYNRAACAPDGKPWDPRRAPIAWDPAAMKWAGGDVPDFKPDSAPEQGMSPFIMNPDGVGRLFALDGMADGPFPEHYEPFESPVEGNGLHAGPAQNPAVRVFASDRARLGTSAEFPYVGTTYRVTEHFHFWTKHARINAILQPEAFVEIGEDLAQEKWIKSGDKVVVRSRRGQVTAMAVVTSRIRALDVNGQQVHVIGLPLHWGFEGLTRPGHLTNSLTPVVGDPNTHTPEYKAFLVGLEKA